MTSVCKIVSLLLNNCKFAAVRNCNVNIWYTTLWGCGPQAENQCSSTQTQSYLCDDGFLLTIYPSLLPVQLAEATPEGEGYRRKHAIGLAVPSKDNSRLLFSGILNHACGWNYAPLSCLTVNTALPVWGQMPLFFCLPPHLNHLRDLAHGAKTPDGKLEATSCSSPPTQHQPPLLS